MIKTPIFKGSCTAVITPFAETGIDYERFAANIEYQYENGTSALVVNGTTGENPTISFEEYEELIRFAVLQNKGRMRIIAGVGSNDTKTALKKAQYAKYTGADGILMVTPYYNKSTQQGMISHFEYVADRVDIPMIIYNVPSRTGVSLTADSYCTLSKHPNINAIKEASGNFSLAAETVSKCGNEIFLISGNDDNTVPLMALGAVGVISVASNIVPGAVAKLCSLCLEGDFQAATELYAKYAALFSALFIETNPIPVKAAMKMLGTDSGIVRLPLVNISDDSLAKLKSVMINTGMNI